MEEDLELQLVVGGRTFSIRVAERDPATEIARNQVPKYLQGSLAHVLNERGKLRWFNTVTEQGRDITAEVGRWPLGANTARKALKNGCDYVIDYALGKPRTTIVDDDVLAERLHRMGLPPAFLEEQER